MNTGADLTFLSVMDGAWYIACTYRSTLRPKRVKTATKWNLSIYRSIYLFISIYLYLSIYIYIYLSIYLSIYPSIYLSIMRPTLGNYFEVGVGYGTICLKWFPIFNINFMLTSANKNHSKIIYAPVTRWWCKIIFHLQRLKHLGIILSKQPKAPQNNFSVELGTLFHRVPTV